MKLRDILLGIPALVAIAVIGVVFMVINFIFTGECFPND